MATVQGPRKVAKLAAGDLSAKQYYIMKLGTTQDQITTCGANEVAYGILTHKPDAAGEIAEVWVDGDELKVVSDGSSTNIAIGDRLKSDANGKAVQIPASQTNQNSIGVALEPSTTDGTIIRFRPRFEQIDT